MQSIPKSCIVHSNPLAVTVPFGDPATLWYSSVPPAMVLLVTLQLVHVQLAAATVSFTVSVEDPVLEVVPENVALHSFSETPPVVRRPTFAFDLAATVV